MNSLTLLRWLKFNLVGAIGMAVQLSLLALFNRMAPGHYLAATAAAIELTLLHNFLWHLQYTWRDRRRHAALLVQLVRFHLSNGLFSLAGNLLLMRILVHQAHLPVVLSNLVAIFCCGILNFSLSHTWAFAQGKANSRDSSDTTPSRVRPESHPA